jgi:hypothetical protein
MERKMAETYTRFIFKKFQMELFESNNCVTEVCGIDDLKKVWTVEMLEGNEQPREVIFQIATNFATCQCKKYDFEGFPCKHILCVLRQSKVISLPESFILRRWTRYAKLGNVYDRSGKIIERDTNETMTARLSNLSYISKTLVERGALSEKAYDTAMKGLCDIMDKVNEVLLEDGFIDYLRPKPKRSKDCNREIEDPNRARPKGSGKRLKSEREKAVKKKKIDRRCHGCGKRGVSHDKRNCPELHGR